MADSSLILRLVVLAVLLFFGGFFSTAETALFSSNRLNLRLLREGGDRRALLVHHLFADPGRLLTTLLVGNTVSAIGASVLATSITLSLLSRHGEWVAFVSVTLLVLIVSEIAPKTMAARHADRMALWVAGPVSAFARLFAPLIGVLSIVATTLIRPFGGSITSKAPHVTEEQLRLLVKVGEEEGVIAEGERAMIHSIFEFSDTLVREVMRPRIDIIGVPSTATINEAIGLSTEYSHSRLPIYEGSVDHIVGVVYLRDLIPALRQGRLDQPVMEIRRPAYFVPETKKVDELFKEMQRKKVSMAIVLDEYGGTAGVVTMEDVLEEIVGEIQDEYDLEEKPIQLLDHDTAVVNARTHIHEVNALLDLHLPDDDSNVDTIAGLVYTLLGRVPAQGETVTLPGAELRVEKTLGQRITKVRITRSVPVPEEEKTLT